MGTAQTEPAPIATANMRTNSPVWDAGTESFISAGGSDNRRIGIYANMRGKPTQWRIFLENPAERIL